MATKRPPSLLRTLRFIALAATLLGSGPLVSSLFFYQTALLTGGIVLDFAPNDALFEPNTTPVLAFVDYQKQKIIATPYSALGADNVLRGDRLRIKYDPVTPENFRLDTPLGMWGASVLKLLYGLVPLIVLSRMIAAKDTPRRKVARAKRSHSITAEHLIKHNNIPPADTPAVRRMR